MTFATDKKWSRLAAAVTAAAVFAFTAAFSAFSDGYSRTTVGREEYSAALNGAFEWERRRLGTDSLCGGFLSEGTAGESEADWFVIAERAAGVGDDYAAYAEEAAKKLEKRLETPSDFYLTEIARTTVALGLCGYPQPDLSVLDLSSAGDNEVIWVIIAQRMGGYDISAAQSELISRQTENGGFGLGSEDADITAMALMALSSDGEPSERAADHLKGYYAQSGGEISCETAAQLIMGLCARGDDPSCSGDFTAENGVRPLDALMSAQTESGGFSHIPGGEENAVSTCQAAAALASMGYRSTTGKWLFESDFEPADVFSVDNPCGEAFDGYDLSLLESMEGVQACDLETLEALKKRADMYGADGTAAEQLDEKLEESRRICSEIERLNAEIRESLYPPDSAGVGDLKTLRRINKEISHFSDGDKALILSADELLNRERALEKRSAAAVTVSALTAVVIVIYIKRKKHGQ